MWYIMQSIQSKYSLSERLIRTIAAIRSFPRDNVEDLIGRVSPPTPPRPGPGSLRNAREGNGEFVGERAEVENPLREPAGCPGAAGAVGGAVCPRFAAEGPGRAAGIPPRCLSACRGEVLAAGYPAWPRGGGSLGGLPLPGSLLRAAESPG